METLASLRRTVRRMVFLEHRPESGEVFLNQRRVFTLPNKPGWFFVLMLLILFIASTNYSLSMGFALTFVLAACATVNAFLGFRNLAYLYLAPGPVQPVFAGEEAQFSLQLINRRAHARYAIWIGFAEGDHPAQAVDIAPNSRCNVQLSCAAHTRGWLPIPRVRLQTFFPLGLLRAWSSWLPDIQALVYPHPEQHAPPLPFIGATQADGQGHAGSEDFSGVRAYQTGDAIKLLAWKHIARVDVEAGGQLFSKQFSGGSANDLLLDYDSLPQIMDTELKLSRLTRWVLEADASGLLYGFRIGNIEYAPNNGPSHRLSCLRALALFSG